MFGKRSLFNHPILRNALIGLISTSFIAQAAPPLWWGQGNTPVIDPNAQPDNKGLANIGQAKWMAKNALESLRATVPTIASQVEADLVGAGKPITSWNPPTTDAEREKQRAPLLVGQLKALAAPFYQRIHASAAPWLLSERALNQMPDTGTYYPWISDTGDGNYSPANIGQLKAVFSLRFTESQDGDSVSDLFEYVNYGSLNSGMENTGTTLLDLDGDGWLDTAEQSAGGNVQHKDNPKLLLQATVE